MNSSKRAESARVLNVTNFFPHQRKHPVCLLVEPQYNACCSVPEYQRDFT
jgi:hypothetical protein